MSTAGQSLLDDVLAIKAGTTINTLFLSFWDIGLYNFPEGGFSKKTISGSNARKLLMEAVQDGKLTCVSDDDLNAPYNDRAKEKHDELRTVLRDHFAIDLSFDDFNHQDRDNNEAYYSILPLQIASISEKSSILVITCCYAMNENRKEGNVLDNFCIAVDTVEFHLFEAVKNKQNMPTKS